MRSLFALAGAAVAALALAGAASAQTTSCTPGSDWGTLRADYARQVVDLVNDHRASLGLRRLVLSPALGRAAEWKALHMARFDYFAHSDLDGRTAFQRARDCGYPSSYVGENIYLNVWSPEAAVAGWLASPGHRANIETPHYAATGVGVALAANGGRLLWVQKFGDVDDTTVQPTPATVPTSGEAAWNAAPRAGADSARLRRGAVRLVRVLRNDSDPDGDRVRLVGIVRQPQHGRASVRADGTIVYRPRAGFVGRDTLTYRIADGRGGYARAAVVLRIVNA
jgi:uncharacterized protein YkwD